MRISYLSALSLMFALLVCSSSVSAEVRSGEASLAASSPVCSVSDYGADSYAYMPLSMLREWLLKHRTSGNFSNFDDQLILHGVQGMLHQAIKNSDYRLIATYYHAGMEPTNPDGLKCQGEVAMHAIRLSDFEPPNAVNLAIYDYNMAMREVVPAAVKANCYIDDEFAKRIHTQRAMAASVWDSLQQQCQQQLLAMQPKESE